MALVNSTTDALKEDLG